MPEPVVTQLPIDDLMPDPDNPNVEDAETFNSLVDAIREVGLVEPILVMSQEDAGYMIVSGEHRWKAAKHLGLETVPCIILEGWDDDIRQINMVRFNALRGHIDPERFTKLFNRLQARYGKDRLRQMMGLSDPGFKRIYRDAAKALGITPKAKDEEKIRTLDDLALVLNTMFSRYGGTIDQHFMLFMYGGKLHMMVELDKEGFAVVENWVDGVRERQEDINHALTRALRGVEA